MAAAALTASAGLAACGGGAGGDASLGPDADVAIQVASEEITNGEIERRATFLARQPTTSGGALSELPPKDSAEFKDFRLTAAGQLLDERVFKILAKKCGKPCAVTQKDLDQQVKNLVDTSFNGVAADFDAALAERGITKADFLASQRAQQEEQLLTEEAQKDVTFSEAEARKLYEKNIDQYKLAAEKRLSHILLDGKAAATALRGQLTAENFADTAKQKSQDPAAKTTGGDLGAINSGGLLPEVSAAAQQLKPGVISQPVESQFGWHLLLVRDIKARTKSFDEVKKDIIDQQLQVERAAAVQKWRDTVFKKQKDAAKYLNPKIAPPQPVTSTTATPTATSATTTVKPGANGTTVTAPDVPVTPTTTTGAATP